VFNDPERDEPEAVDPDVERYGGTPKPGPYIPQPGGDDPGTGDEPGTGDDPGTGDGGGESGGESGGEDPADLTE